MEILFAFHKSQIAMDTGHWNGGLGWRSGQVELNERVVDEQPQILVDGLEVLERIGKVVEAVDVAQLDLGQIRVVDARQVEFSIKHDGLFGRDFKLVNIVRLVVFFDELSEVEL